MNEILIGCVMLCVGINYAICVSELKDTWDVDHMFTSGISVVVGLVLIIKGIVEL